MASNRKGVAIVIMGVTGSGKSTIGQMLAEDIKCSFLDADDFHPPENKEKMSRGIPLSEDDRIPWLETLRDAIRDHVIYAKNVVLSCSALQKKYREILRSGDPDYRSMNYVCHVKFVCLDAPPDVLAARMQTRAKEGNHFMPASLLQSQLDLLQIDSTEGIVTVDATLSPKSIVASILVRIPLI